MDGINLAPNRASLYTHCSRTRLSPPVRCNILLLPQHLRQNYSASDESVLISDILKRTSVSAFLLLTLINTLSFLTEIDNTLFYSIISRRTRLFQSRTSTNLLACTCSPSGSASCFFITVQHVSLSCRGFTMTSCWRLFISMRTQPSASGTEIVHKPNTPQGKRAPVASTKIWSPDAL